MINTNSNKYTKLVTKKEADIYQLSSNNNISPNVYSVRKIDNCEDIYEYEVIMEKYDKVLLDIPEEERYNYYPLIIEKLNKFHNLGILWIDIHEENVVINENTENGIIDVRLIDFGPSVFTPAYNQMEKIDGFYQELSLSWFDKTCGNPLKIGMDKCIENFRRIEKEEIDLICCMWLSKIKD